MSADSKVQKTRSEEQIKRLSEVVELDRRQGLSESQAHEATRTTQARYVDCRVFGHAWEATEADRNPAIGWYMKLRCTRCGTVRSDIVNRYGGVESRHYTYPEFYKDTDKWTRSDWRLQYIRRL